MTPFRVLLGVHPRIRDNSDIRELFESEVAISFDDDRMELRAEAKRNIEKIQRGNKKTYDRKRKAPLSYREGDLVAIKRTQQGPYLKLAHKYLGPYEVVKVLRNHRYFLRKIAEIESLIQTSSAADHMKHCIHDDDYDNVSEDIESDERSRRPSIQNGRV